MVGDWGMHGTLLSTQAPFEASLILAGPEELVAEPYDCYVIMFILTIVY